jgi:hypothetical protein
MNAFLLIVVSSSLMVLLYDPAERATNRGVAGS